MFADLALARRIDGAEASLSADIAEAIIRSGRMNGAFSRPFAGGVAVCGGPMSPITKIIGAGFDGAAPGAALDQIEADYAACGANARVEVATLADPAFVQQLGARGYVLHAFENVLARSLAGSTELPAPPASVTMEQSTDPQAFIDTMIDGFASPDTGVVSAPGESFPREDLERMFADLQGSRGFIRYVALVDGATAGAGSMRLYEGVAQLCGAATLPSFRRRGVQSAMLTMRLREAAAAGCDVAVVTTEPGSKSQQNVQRAGFVLLYTRAVLIRASQPAA